MSTFQRRYELTDTQWETIKNLLPPERTGQKGRPKKDTRKMMNAILWVLKSGAAWRDLPERYGPWQTVYSRFVKLQKDAIIDQICRELGMDDDFSKHRIGKKPAKKCGHR